MSFWVRNATNADVPGIVETIKSVYDEYGFGWWPDGYHADLHDVDHHYWKCGHAFWVAESLDDPQVVLGTCALHVFDPFPLGADLVEVDNHLRVGGADCSLERLYVQQQARGMGMGVALFSHCIAAAKERGKRRMEIWSDKRLLQAHGLYEKFGAEMVGERICHDPEQSPEFGLMLDLRTVLL